MKGVHDLRLTIHDSKGFRASLAGADSDGLIEIEDKNLAITDLAGVGGIGNSLYHLVQNGIIYPDLDLDLG